MAGKLKAVEPWTAPAIAAKFKETVTERGIKMPQVMMPLRLALTGQSQTPSMDGITAALRKEVVLERLQRAADSPAS